MEERTWLTSGDPAAMLALLIGTNGETGRSGMEAEPPEPPQFPASARKLRLFAVAVNRTYLRPLLADSPGSIRSLDAAIDLAERHADGAATDRALAVSHGRSNWYVTAPDAGEAAAWSLGDVRGRKPKEGAAALLRCVFGNPYRPVPPSNLDWHYWREGGGHGRVDMVEPPKHRWLTANVLGVARGAYEERLPDGTLDPVRLELLADALMDAGCDDEDILNHCRGLERCWLCARVNADPEKDACSACGQLGEHGPHGRPCAPGWAPLRGSHARGCWVLDLILGKG